MAAIGSGALAMRAIGGRPPHPWCDEAAGGYDEAAWAGAGPWPESLMFGAPEPLPHSPSATVNVDVDGLPIDVLTPNRITVPIDRPLPSR